MSDILEAKQYSKGMHGNLEVIDWEAEVFG